MSKQRIRWIVALMAVGLLGLVGLQGYYITSAWRLQREQFDYKVTDALQEVVRTLERREITDLSRQRIRAQQQQQRLMAISRKSEVKPAFARKNRPVTTPTEDLIARRIRQRRAGSNGLEMPSTVVIQSDVLHSQTQPITPEQALVVATFFEQQEMLAVAGEWQAQAEQQRQFEDWANRELVGQMNQFNDELSRAYQQADSLRQRQLAAKRNQRQRLKSAQKVTQAKRTIAADSQSIGKRAEEKTQMVKGVLKELLLSERPIAERLDRLTLDTLLRESLAERSISLPFSYGVRSDRTSSGKPQFLFATYHTDANRMLQMGYRAVLFPDNPDAGNHLYVYFPTRKEFIWSQMGFTLAASALLILTILACFYIAITTIIRQKKMADIKNDFINNMTHEFKTPISTISLAVEMAENVGGWPGARGEGRGDTEEAGRMARYLGIIRDETRRLGSHVEKVLQMALLDRGAVKLTLVPVNVHDVVEKVLNTIGLQIEQRGGELVLDFEADNEMVEADEVHLTNIVYNLVDNAIKYSPDKPHITIRTQSLPDGVSLTVADQGLGLSKEQQSRIFETFYRVPTGNLHDVKGFGLGLSYVRKMVDAHHGRITVDSQPGQGSSFEVVIPYKMNNV
ncbi:MAG: HAMP domain-containing histidine kinase [Rudanella sp.]|nr:HAMP domain-containing histidine kinase [Rudanella sp.]